MEGMEYGLGCIATPPERLEAAIDSSRSMMAALGGPRFPDPPSNHDSTCGFTAWEWVANNYAGTCVTASEVNYKLCIGQATLGPPIVIPDANGINWARQNGGMNGMGIDTCLERMQKVGMTDAAGKVHTNGPYGAVNWKDQTEAMRAIHYFKALKIGVNGSPSGILHRTHTAQSGWEVMGARPAGVNHCVEILGYGSAEFLASVCKSKLTKLDPKAFCVLLFTWCSVGIVDWPSFVALCGEAWVRITDPDRGDASAWDMVAQNDFAALTA